MLAAAATVTAWAIAAPGHAQPSQIPTPDFIRNAAATDAFEVRAGKIAEMRGLTQPVKDFGAMMIMDHTQTTAALQKAIHEAALPAPGPVVLSPAQRQMLKDLNHVRPGRFDRMYIKDQIEVHQQALNLMQGYAHGGEVPVLREAATSTIPMVQMHLAKAQDIRKTLPK
jgi:putative membrane protein